MRAEGSEMRAEGRRGKKVPGMGFPDWQNVPRPHRSMGMVPILSLRQFWTNFCRILGFRDKGLGFRIAGYRARCGMAPRAPFTLVSIALMLGFVCG